MNLYVKIMNQVVDYIDENLSQPLGLQDISQHFYLSEFHFSRIFKITTGASLKKYVLGRKLALAAERLRNTERSVIDIANEYGFEYPEVFSRDFKKWYGVAPTAYKNGDYEISPMPKAAIIDRDIMNFQGVLALKETYTYLDEQNLYGVFLEVDENSSDFSYMLQSTGERFLTDRRNYDCLKDNSFYTVVNCYGDDSGRYSVFYGGELSKRNNDCNLKVRNIPAGWYACFSYYGEMVDMRKTFNDDFYRWMIVKEIEPCPNGIGMLNIYDREDMKNVRILVPVKRPK